MSRSEIVNRIIEEGVVAVIRMADSRKLMNVASAIQKGGISIIEITMTTPNALKVIETVSQELVDVVLVGVGSVLNEDVANQAMDAGAKYVVSPIFKPEIIEAAHRRDIPAMPGAFTPTEIQLAHERGADIIKVFPADIVGMNFFKGVKAPMPHVRLMPTGGVTLTNGGDWIKAGACAVGVGSALLDKQAIADDNYVLLTQNARTLRQSVLEGQNTVTGDTRK
ncbi:bifunctional 4-hydroxy-2-oxoglutarate aldolase/2-dehydro-3-deoxy-phosphogluconate aldolase [candidate division KSB1 bacterium]|nr:bifunctional 4-hydroxy-2-oxoglutarate aldolase/2-dehydro-3-deoxy-phosphogluconate aldolase [candidate division KSB1 bacterium]NIV70251.1 bifunctional 4-hydroxy-2-oxoglutarate aldolase/2-dehydro-3-deoxy-phosphogluconate aldolase [Phycisphaerae bacterium]NIR71650.1 bifunctional 4-hydroxy-2-oxoglutarate aldolase/2-dehydro-3-deoxy-phosphogluconate aldolase [candidate division KSB1 bacterium]NIT74575.1 bifunctional 4-hydroxy-2-oxoglutarate aldolase/2-dehydro-3-deoxy-phosphogluconate aldolase [cand